MDFYSKGTQRVSHHSELVCVVPWQFFCLFVCENIAHCMSKYLVHTWFLSRQNFEVLRAESQHLRTISKLPKAVSQLKETSLLFSNPLLLLLLLFPLRNIVQ